MKICAFDSCGRKSRARGFCGAHYQQYMAGKPLVPPVERRSQYNGELCEVEDCLLVATRHNLCQAHYWRVRRHGDVNIVDTPPGHVGRKGSAHPTWVGDRATNAAVHARLYVLKGRASEYPCIDCGDQAKHWAYQYGCENELQSPRGAYSLDPNRYEPMCGSCHKKFDNKMSGRTRCSS